jgi:hypothetical protein
MLVYNWDTTMQTKRVYRITFPFLVLFLAGLACNFPQEGTPTPSGPELLKTYAAQTIEVQLTLVATGIQPTITPGENIATVTSSPSSPATQVISATSTPTATQGVCDQAGFEKDVTIPDNTTLDAGEEFTKTWQLRNDGTCTWNSNYAIVFERGDAMGGPASAQLTSAPIAPGETVDVSLDLTAPESPGTYQGYWKLRNPAGQVFGLGTDGEKEFWVKIKIAPESGITYDFNIQAKSASWTGSDGGGSVDIAFGGADDDPNGVAKLKDDFLLENGKTSGVALVTGPKVADDGKITGIFPSYTIAQNDHFMAKLGFPQKCNNGRVIFRFSLQQGGTVTQLEQWPKACTGGLVFADVDLSDYAGQEVQFVLDVLADGSPEKDLVVWGSARIEREE